MINAENYHYLHRIAKRTIPFLHKKNRFDKVMERKKNHEANNLISNLIQSDKPFMVGRLGSTETRFIVNSLLQTKIKSDTKGIFQTLSGDINILWKKDPVFLDNLCLLSGFFPNDVSFSEKFIQIYEESISNLDVLGVWNEMEFQIENIPQETKLCKIREIEPWFYDEPWSYQLEGKKVLVIHPFENSIKHQFLHKNDIYKNSKTLPDFELKTIKAVQTLAGQESEFEDWFEALESMKEKITKTDFDIAIIGCGAYGFPLASFVKDQGKQAIHLGGVTQLMFGIKGKRWEDWEHYTELRKDHGKNWISANEKPQNYNKIEDGCYW